MCGDYKNTMYLQYSILHKNLMVIKFYGLPLNHLNETFIDFNFMILPLPYSTFILISIYTIIMMIQCWNMHIKKFYIYIANAYNLWAYYFYGVYYNNHLIM